MNSVTKKEIDKIFLLAIENYKKGNDQKAIEQFKEIINLSPDNLNAYTNLGAIFFKNKKYDQSIEYYNRALKINPNHINSLNNIGVAFKEIGNLEKALKYLENIIELDEKNLSALNNIGLIHINLKNFEKSKKYFQKVLKKDPNYVDALNNMGIVYKNEKKYENSIKYYKKAIEVNPKYLNSYYNLGCAYKDLKSYNEAIKYLNHTIEIFNNHEGALHALGSIYEEQGKYNKSLDYYNQIIKKNPNNKFALNNAGVALINKGEIKKAKINFKKSLKIDPTFIGAYWNLCGTANSMKEVILILNQILKIDKGHVESRILLSAFENLTKDTKDFEKSLNSINRNHHYFRSALWYFSLTNRPLIFFNRWQLFDKVVSISNKSRPFYEFGVWNGSSFKYLIKSFKEGYGFDTFEGIPDAWHKEPKGSYSNYGKVPKIPGGNFIVGKFEDELPNFFKTKRPIASLINFDADLYSSTICALENCRNIIDTQTILIFDEFIMNEKWEQDEFKALNEFCENYNFVYKVLAVSFFSKQVAVKLERK